MGTWGQAAAPSRRSNVRQHASASQTGEGAGHGLVPRGASYPSRAGESPWPQAGVT